MAEDQDAIAEIRQLKSSRSRCKATVSRKREPIKAEISAHDHDQDPAYLSLRIEQWEEALHKFREANDQVMRHSHANDDDADQHLEEHEADFARAKADVKAIRDKYILKKITAKNGGRSGCYAFIVTVFGFAFLLASSAPSVKEGIVSYCKPILFARRLFLNTLLEFASKFSDMCLYFPLCRYPCYLARTWKS